MVEFLKRMQYMRLLAVAVLEHVEWTHFTAVLPLEFFMG